MLPLEIAIAGCGPAGMAAALLLERQGHRVRIFERFEKPAPLGAGLLLQPTGQAVLAELGVLDRISAAGARIDRLFGKAVPSGRVVLDVRYDALDAGYAALAVHRATLFNALYEAVNEARIPVEPGIAIAGLDTAGEKPALLTETGRRLGPFDIIIDALGARSPLSGAGRRKPLAYSALWATLPWPGGFDSAALEQRYRKASRMAGVLPAGLVPGLEGPQATFFWSLKPAEHAAWLARGLDAWKADVLALWPDLAPLLEAIRDPRQLTLATYAHGAPRAAAGRRFASIGDSAHTASPQLGQGANMALLDAFALAQTLSGPAELSDALARYAKARRRHVQLFQALSFMFTPFYQSDSAALPFLRDRVVAPLSRLPVANALLAAIVAGTVGWPLRRLGLKPFRLAAERR